MDDCIAGLYNTQILKTLWSLLFPFRYISFDAFNNIPPLATAAVIVLEIYGKPTTVTTK